MDFFYSAGNTLKSTFEIYLQLLAPLESIFGYRFLSSLVFLVLILGGWFFAIYLKRAYSIRIKKLQDLLLDQEQRYTKLMASSQAYKKFLSKLMTRQREQATYIYTSLDVAHESLNNPIIRISAKEREEIIHSCIAALNFLSKGLIMKMETKSIILKKLLEKVSIIFAAKVFRSNINLEFIYPEDLSFYGDPLVIELILMTLMGKSIYRTPKNEKITIFVKEKEGALHLEVQDKGYASARKEKFIRQAFHHLIEDEGLYALCQENGFLYECSRMEDGLNIGTLIIPINLQKTVSAANVTHLFKKKALFTRNQ